MLELSATIVVVMCSSLHSATFCNAVLYGGCVATWQEVDRVDGAEGGLGVVVACHRNTKR